MIIQQGSINTTALIVPDLYVQIVPPSVTLLNGVPTNGIGIVGTATFGPVNSPVVVGDMAAYALTFGAIQNRKYDMGTGVAAAVLQGANNMICVRVTDGTDVAASIAILVNCMTVAAKYTGSFGNQIVVSIGNGSKVGTYKAIVSLAGYVPEVFDNVGVGMVGNAIWADFVNGINNGQGGLRGPSQLIVATLGVGVTAPAIASYSPVGGTDGATTITGAVLVGVDTVPRKGMYALRNSGVGIAFLADCDDTTQFAAQVAYGLAEGTYMIGTTPAGDSISNAITVKGTAGIDSYAFKYMFGDWIAFNDTVNMVQRLISPQGFVAGRLANLSPEQSSLNKPLFGIVATQKALQSQTYSGAELQLLGQAGIDVIANPIPAGKMFGVRFGHNSSSNPVTNGDNYTRMTNYIAASLNAGMGLFVGKLQSDTLRREAKGTIVAFLGSMENQGMIGGANGAQAFSVQLDANNNPTSRVALGYMQADVNVTYLSVVEKFLVNLQGGQSVVVTKL